ncbi:MAG: hypothetical protein ACHQF2_06975 [Flavobacteriales bacterium]
MRIILILLILLPTWSYSQNVAVNNTGAAANTHAILDVDVSTNDKGVLIPRLATAERTAIAGLGVADEGLIVYDETTNSFWFWDGTQWVEMSNAGNQWLLLGNAGTNPATNFIGTTDNTDLVVRTNSTEAMRVSAAGNVGIGTATPGFKLHVVGDVRISGDFTNQEITGIHASAVQSVPFTNGVFNPINGTPTSITINDGNGVANSGVFISGFARVFGGTLAAAGNSAWGGYFLILQRDVTPAFATAVNLTYTSGSCFMKTPNGISSATIGFGGGGHVSYSDLNLVAGTTYYYRLVLYPNGVGITGGTYDVYERDLSVIQIKR